jgi:hypothetical protein
MIHKLTVFIDNTSVLEYDRNQRLPGKQREYLDKMDLDMDQGFELGGEKIDVPDKNDRAKFVAMNLLRAIDAENEAMMAATCSYLANRYDDLAEVRANISGEDVMMDLVFDQGEKVAFSKSIN